MIEVLFFVGALIVIVGALVFAGIYGREP